MKLYYIQFNIGKSKYVVNFHNGLENHSDGSPFFDCRIFRNKIKLNKFIRELAISGYKEMTTL